MMLGCLYVRVGKCGIIECFLACCHYGFFDEGFGRWVV